MPNGRINLDYIKEIRRMRDRLDNMAKEIEISSSEINEYDIQNKELAETPLSKLTIRKAIDLDDRRGSSRDVPKELQDIADTPLSELNLIKLTRTVERLKKSGDINPAAQTFIACGGGGCIVYDNGVIQEKRY